MIMQEHSINDHINLILSAKLCDKNWADMLLKAVGQVSEGGSGRHSSKGATFDVDVRWGGSGGDYGDRVSPICSKHGELTCNSPFELLGGGCESFFGMCVQWMK